MSFARSIEGKTREKEFTKGQRWMGGRDGAAGAEGERERERERAQKRGREKEGKDKRNAQEAVQNMVEVAREWSK